MTDTPLVQEKNVPAPRSRRTAPLAIALAVVALAIVAGGAAWWFYTARQAVPDWDRTSDVDLAAPAGDAFAETAPWLDLQLSPARPSEPNTIHISLAMRSGTPVPGDMEHPRITALTAQSLAGDDDPAPLSLERDADGSVTASALLDEAGWWHLNSALDDGNSVDFYLLLPDPNVNGPGSVPTSDSSADGEALFQRGIAGITGLRSVRFTQWLGDGRGNGSFSEHAVTAGGDGTPAAFTYRAAGGMDAVVIGDTRWIQLPGDLGWTQQEGAIVVPPAEWGDEYLGATGFTLLGEETIDGEPCQVLAFVVPETTEPRRQTAAWYLWWIGTESGHLRREAMVSRLHYMQNRFSDFDAPMTIAPPEDAATPASATPVIGSPTA
jgi:hypothetical protein